MVSIYDDDPFPPIWGPQAPHVSAILEQLRGFRAAATRPFLSGLLEAVEEFLEASRVLDTAERADALRSAHFESLTFEGRRDSLAEFRAAMFAYLNAGYAVLDAAAVYDLGSSRAEPWNRWAGQLERLSADPVRRTLARILTIRLREPRHAIAVHRRGWTVPALIIGRGAASLSRRPQMTPPATPNLVSEVAAAFKTLGIEARNVEAMIPMAAQAFLPRAAECTPALRSLYSRLLNQYGIQTSPVAAITPSLLALITTVAS